MNQRPWPARALSMMAALSLGSCVSIEQSAPRVEMLPPYARVASAEQLAQGRDIYLTKCAKCHQVEPVRKYPASEWQHTILPEMSDEAKLSATESAAVHAYVMSVLRSPAA
jgi:mono/diheme cytochrome c family protein